MHSSPSYLKRLAGCLERLFCPSCKPVIGLKPLCKESDISSFRKIVFKENSSPYISIVIPAYNQFAYTYNCLESILENASYEDYEVIVADDCSADLTKQIGDIFDGITVARSEKNSGFVKNCNSAARLARGKYIVFLNNDTQVRKGWLSSLVRLMESDDKIGLSGSKLIYPDGRLQEAGGILFKDGTAANFGNGFNPDMPKFNKLREADYISGASIIIRADLWREIGGFDERFAPAYCEDSDLAMEVRKRGYKVVYQPGSVVVHFEGVSNGIDVKKGLKRYQAVNQKKFYDKWKAELLRKG